ncbi:hypothetical protein BOX15_Mlig029845g3 [Macrostomum lignano]|uniref:EF-hand domain-containing protein n=2 Tax=Macrostomum lignano TaxID=282301 RepID=A0A267EIT3_9PLAT|nr:hypothetical protein BOX15_Mlig029845g3 [Macrostomum lignano]
MSAEHQEQQDMQLALQVTSSLSPRTDPATEEVRRFQRRLVSPMWRTAATDGDSSYFRRQMALRRSLPPRLQQQQQQRQRGRQATPVEPTRSFTEFISDVIVPIPVKIPQDEYNYQRSVTSQSFHSTSKLTHVQLPNLPQPDSDLLLHAVSGRPSTSPFHKTVSLCGERYTVTPINGPTPKPMTAGGRGRARPRTVQQARFDEGAVALGRCRLLKRSSEILPHRVDRMYFMSGSGLSPTGKYGDAADGSESDRYRQITEAVKRGEVRLEPLKKIVSSKEAVNFQNQPFDVTGRRGFASRQRGAAGPLDASGLIVGSPIIHSDAQHAKQAENVPSNNAADAGNFFLTQETVAAGSSANQDAPDVSHVQVQESEPEPAEGQDEQQIAEPVAMETQPDTEDLSGLPEEQPSDETPQADEAASSPKPEATETDEKLPNNDEEFAEAPAESAKEVDASDATVNEEISPPTPEASEASEPAGLDVVDAPPPQATSLEEETPATGTESKSPTPAPSPPVEDAIEEANETLVVKAVSPEVVESNGTLSDAPLSVSVPAQNRTTREDAEKLQSLVTRPLELRFHQQDRTRRISSGNKSRIDQILGGKSSASGGGGGVGVSGGGGGATRTAGVTAESSDDDDTDDEDEDEEDEDEEEEISEDELMEMLEKGQIKLECDKSVFSGVKYRQKDFERMPDKRTEFREVTKHLVVKQEITGKDTNEILHIEPNMTPEQADAFVKLFDELDINKDGRIAMEEVQKRLDVFKSKRKTDVKKFIRVFDLNGDRTVDVREFLAVAALNDSLCKQKTTDPKADWNLNLDLCSYYITVYKEMFEMADQSKNGKLGLEELMVIVAVSLDTESGTDVQLIEDILNSMDRDHSGEIDFVEYLTYIPVFLKLHQFLLKKPMLVEDLEKARRLIKKSIRGKRK